MKENKIQKSIIIILCLSAIILIIGCGTAYFISQKNVSEDEKTGDKSDNNETGKTPFVESDIVKELFYRMNT